MAPALDQLSVMPRGSCARNLGEGWKVIFLHRPGRRALVQNEKSEAIPALIELSLAGDGSFCGFSASESEVLEGGPDWCSVYCS